MPIERRCWPSEARMAKARAASSERKAGCLERASGEMARATPASPVDPQKSRMSLFLYVPICPPHTPVVPTLEFVGTSGGVDAAVPEPAPHR